MLSLSHVLHTYPSENGYKFHLPCRWVAISRPLYAWSQSMNSSLFPLSLHCIHTVVGLVVSFEITAFCPGFLGAVNATIDWVLYMSGWTGKYRRLSSPFSMFKWMDMKFLFSFKCTPKIVSYSGCPMIGGINECGNDSILFSNAAVIVCCVIVMTK